MQLTLRRDAAQATIDAFLGKPFQWGKYDCARLGAFALKQLGYKPNLSRGGYYRNALGAQRALTRLGFADLAEALDDLGLPRITPAAALPGDIVGIRHPDQDGVGLAVETRHQRLLMFYADGVCRIGPIAYGVEGAEYYAWRADPCR